MADDTGSLVKFDDLRKGLASAEALRRGDDPTEALRLLDGLRAAFPEHPMPVLSAASVLRQLGRYDDCDALLDALAPRFPNEFGFVSARAWSAHHRSDVAKALRLWQEARERFPDEWRAATGAAATLRSAGRLDEADAVLAEVMARFPELPFPAIEHARLAQARQDLPEAARRWEGVRARFPDLIEGYAEAAMTLRALRRIAEAEILMDEAVRRFGENAGLATERVRLALFDNPFDADKALSRLAHLREHYPDYEPGFEVGVDVLREAGRLAEAGSLASSATQRFPRNVTMAVRRADIARALGNLPETLVSMTELRQRFPGHPFGHLGLMQALVASERWDDAERVGIEAERAFPDNADIAIAHASIAIHRKDWKTALGAFRALRDRFPGDQRIEPHIFETSLRVAETDPAAAELANDRGDRKDLDIESPRELVMQFESLGGSGHGCEFGIFQRSFDAEPLGLLRWADLSHHHLTDALNSRFEGVGDQANTEVIVPHPEGDAEYWTRDRRYWMAMRCFIRADSIAQDKMEEQACRRLRYLRDKLIEDLKAGNKLFVYKNMFRDLTEQELDGLHQAVHGYGPNTTLFYVRYADAANSAGTVRLAKPGLIVGYIEHFAFSPENKQLPSATQHWLGLCKAAFALWRSQTAMPDAKAADAADELDMRELMMRFESLGAIEGGCEFGLVQRAFGAEPLGLLRWTEVGPDKLIAALESEFAGVGDPAHTELITTPAPSGPGEYQTRDRRFGMRMHTFVQADTIEHETMLAQSCRRLQFLRRKLLDDLREADKIFVYKITKGNLAPAEIGRLHAALRRYGQTTLLYVRYADDGHPNGTVEPAGPGLMIGYIDRFNVTPDGKVFDPALDSWETICRRAYVLWRSGDDGNGLPPIAGSGPQPIAAAPASGMSGVLTREFLTSATFEFCRRDGSVISDTVRLLENGRISGINHVNESFWDFVDGRLRFLHLNRTPTTAFTQLVCDQDGLTLVGDFIPNGTGQPWHLLRDASSRGMARNATAARAPRSSGSGPKVAVLLRSHHADAKFCHLWNVLDTNRLNYDLFAVVDETGGRPDLPDSVGDRVIWHSNQACAEYGLKHTHPRLLWLCGDFPMYFALMKKPDYDYYIMLEYDLHFVDGDARYMNGFIERLLSDGCGRPDAVGLCFRTMPPQWEHARTAAGKFDPIFHYFFPLIALSNRAVSYLYTKRLFEARQIRAAEDIMYCEVFLPSNLMNAGFRCCDVNDLIPNSYTDKLAHLPLPGLPLGARPDCFDEVKFVHPVYKPEDYLKRRLAYCGTNVLSLTAFVQEMDSPEMAGVDEVARRYFQSEARKKIEMNLLVSADRQ